MKFDEAISKIPYYLGLDYVTKVVGNWLDKHPTVNKIVMVVNHIFRTVAMVALMYMLPFHPAANMAIAFGASVFYRITVERFCPYRFALTSCITAGAFEISKPYLLQMISGVAFSSLSSFGIAFLGVLPILASIVFTIIISNTAVDIKYQKQQQAAKASCCGE